MTLTHFDLFSGIGGFALAAKWAGIETIGFSEIDPFCCKLLEKNFPNVPNYKDIKSMNNDYLISRYSLGPLIRTDIPWPPTYLNHIDILTGGFPCQPFSQAGKKRGKDDKRYLWPEFRRLIEICKPTWVIIENVVGLLKLVDEIQNDLDTRGYFSNVLRFPASAIGVPHKRERLFIIAYNYGKRCFSGSHIWQTRQTEEDQERYMETVQQEWSQLKPKSWETYEARKWFSINASHSRGNDGISTQLDTFRIKALGNAVVPQVVYPIFMTIKYIEEQLHAQ